MTKRNRAKTSKTDTPAPRPTKTNRDDALGRRARARRESFETLPESSETTMEKVVDAAPDVAVVSESHSETRAADEPTQGDGTMITLNRVRIKKNGGAAYAIPGVTGQVRIAKAAFGGGEPPLTIQISADGLAQPNPEKAAKSAAKLERRTKLASTREERARAAQERADKAIARAAKLKALAEKHAPKAEAQNAAVAANLANQGVQTEVGETVSQ